MKIVRTWPHKVPPHRGHVLDDLPRHIMRGYSYRGLFNEVDDDVLILEWDIAASFEHLSDMRDLIATEPDVVHAAPYRVYLVPRDPGPHWVMRRYDEAGDLQWVTEDDKTCHAFGFGMTYVPREVSRAYLAANPRRLASVSDTSFSRWHFDNVRAEVPIPWHIRPVHLHYEL